MPAIFTTILWSKALLGVAAGLVLAPLVYVNVRLAARIRGGDVLADLKHGGRA